MVLAAKALASRMRPFRCIALISLSLMLGWGGLQTQAQPSATLTLWVKKHRLGAPVLVGLPFPRGVLYSSDHVRLEDPAGQEVPAQVTEVTTWEPADSSLKWLWVFFFTGPDSVYCLRYGPEVRRTLFFEPRVTVVNNQREDGGAEVATGPLRFVIHKGRGGFLQEVWLDEEGDGFEADDRIAIGPEGRGSFLDLLDDLGPDSSEAIVLRITQARGTGPLHAVLKIEGEYRYRRPDNSPAPFVTYLHAYAGQAYVRVLHTITYTGNPDKHRRQPGQYAPIATSADGILDERQLQGDPGWTQPDDRIAGAGLALVPQLGQPLRCVAGYFEGSWWNPGAERLQEQETDPKCIVLQNGPNPTRTPPLPSSTPDRRLEGFTAQLSGLNHPVERAVGWLNLRGPRGGIAWGIRSFFEEYPKALEGSEARLTAFLWPPQVEPMHFARWSADEFDGEMLGNFAQGLTKTTELVLFFHSPRATVDAVRRVLGYILDPPVVHADPSWYAQSLVYGRWAPATEKFPEFERSLSYKFAWWRFNQQWEPWYGMFDFGDGMTYYFRDEWFMWNNNEPAIDFMWWLQFMRTGSREAYLTAEAASRHSMDVDNIHWPADPVYNGETNSALDYWVYQKQPKGTPYLGIGRRHGRQHWTALLSAHVWLPGWLAAYYLAGYHRGLDVARLTGETYLKRIWGEHDLRGRRLYLSVWNLVELWDATKDLRYEAELKDRVQLMLRLQEEQGGNLVVDRYGYAQVYASHGLYRYWQLTGDAKVRQALIRHARYVRDVPPLNHEMESYLSSIHSLLVGYEFTAEKSFLEEALRRAEVLKTEALPDDAFERMTQRELASALEAVSHLPESSTGRPAIWKITNGLRVFGWTHAFNVSWLLYWLTQR